MIQHVKFFYRGKVNGECLLYLTKSNLLEDLKLNYGSAIVILQRVEKLRKHLKKI